VHSCAHAATGMTPGISALARLKDFGFWLGSGPVDAVTALSGLADSVVSLLRADSASGRLCPSFRPSSHPLTRIIRSSDSEIGIHIRRGLVATCRASAALVRSQGSSSAAHACSSERHFKWCIASAPSWSLTLTAAAVTRRSVQDCWQLSGSSGQSKYAGASAHLSGCARASFLHALPDRSKSTLALDSDRRVESTGWPAASRFYVLDICMRMTLSTRAGAFKFAPSGS
jgi:hypothetical protein